MALVKERLKVDWTSVNRTAFIDSMIEVQGSGVFTVDEHAEVSGATCTAPSQPLFHPTPRFALRSLLQCSIIVRRLIASNDDAASILYDQRMKKQFR